MSEPLTIHPEPPANPGLDYAHLKAEGIALLQRMAGEIWTDYNESDPGVTTLEQLCYALTELSYRAELPLEDLLTGHPHGGISPRRQALYPAKRIFPCNPLTVNDYRKLIVDRVPEVANVWLRPRRPRSEKGVDGLYDISVYVPGLEPPPCAPEATAEVRRRVRQVYCRHRNLCEDVRAIRVLRPVRAAVHADVSLEEAGTPETVLAGLLFQLGNFFAPELRRRPLQSFVDAGALPSEIFEGPLLWKGFIDDAQLQPKAAQIPVRDVVKILARGTGVAGVRNVEVRIGGRIYDRGCIPVPPRDILRVDTLPDPRGAYSIRLFRKGIEIRPDPWRVQRELDKLRADQRRRYRLKAQYEELFAFPRGRYRDVEPYDSIQNQFPDVYGINAFGLPSDAPEARRGQARQLKGYLLVFEQLLANFFAQLARARDLYSTEEGLRHTYFYQSLDGSVPDVEPLLARSYPGGLACIVQSQDAFVERRNRFLDVLLALYAESLDASGVWESERREEAEESEDAGERLIRAKLALLHRLVASTHNRGRGFDYLARPSWANIAGMEIKSRIQLGTGAVALDDLDREPAEDRPQEPGPEPQDRRLYIVEHTLLRFGRRWKEGEEPGPFTYSFTITAVLSLPSGARSEEYRAFAREVIRRNTPSHVVAGFCFLSPSLLPDFERHDRRWRRALRQGDRREIAVASARLRRFLKKYQDGPCSPPHGVGDEA